jgi:N utilization substance protein B
VNAGSRRKGRELAMKLLYQCELGGSDLDTVCGTFEEFTAAAATARDFSLFLARGVQQNRAEIDTKLKESLKGWSEDRLAAIDATVMRVAIFELLFCDDIPARVAIDEAIDLSREYSTEGSSKFVNGVLDAVATRHAAHKLTQTKNT